MTFLIALWLAALVALPMMIVFASYSKLSDERLRGLSVFGALVLTAVTSVVPLVPALASFVLPSPEAFAGLLGNTVLRMDSLGSLLVPLPAVLWLLTVAVLPRAQLDRGRQRRNALSTIIATFAFLSTSPLILFVAWTLSVGGLVRAHDAPEYGRVRRVIWVYLGGATLLLAVGLALHLHAESEATRSLGLWLVAGAAAIRKGIFPFHAWIPEVTDRGNLGPSVLFSAPQLGAYVVAVIVVPAASATLLHAIVAAALLTAVYAAAMAIHQRDARRAAGYLFVSQSALVMTGLDALDVVALSGSIVLWISSALAFAGLSRVILVLDARRGRLDLSHFHGGFRQMPILAASFLIMGLACMGFPGTLGFVGQEMILQGALHAFPVAGLSVIAAEMLVGVAVLRMYFSLFCGRPDGGTHLDALPRESIAFAAVAALLVGLGLAPASTVQPSRDAAERIMNARIDRVPSGEPEKDASGTH